MTRSRGPAETRENPSPHWSGRKSPPAGFLGGACLHTAEVWLHSLPWPALPPSSRTARGPRDLGEAWRSDRYMLHARNPRLDCREAVVVRLGLLTRRADILMSVPRGRIGRLGSAQPSGSFPFSDVAPFNPESSSSSPSAATKSSLQALGTPSRRAVDWSYPRAVSFLQASIPLPARVLSGRPRRSTTSTC